MNRAELEQLVSAYVSGLISEQQHQDLESELSQNAESRRVFRELVDLEISLSEWSRGGGESRSEGGRSFEREELLRRKESRQTSWSAPRWALVVAGLSAVLIGGWVLIASFKHDQFAGVEKVVESPSIPRSFGTIREKDCVWQEMGGTDVGLERPTKAIIEGRYRLVSGVAQLAFDSGSRLTLQGPSELIVDSVASATFLGGSVVVNVSELSDGFLLSTPEAEIVDLGTEYGVTLDESMAEIHVFDGSVIWKPNGASENEVTTITNGQASRFSRREPTKANRIPWGQRKFVREMESEIQRKASGDLIAFDGFENLAGKIRQGRSGFGWSGGWQPPGRRRGNATIVDAPPGISFGHDRTGLRMIELANGGSIQRSLERPLVIDKAPIYFSFILYRQSELGKDSSFQFSISEETSGRAGRRQIKQVGLGISSDGFPFLKYAGVIQEVATRISHEAMFCVVRIDSVDELNRRIQFRIFSELENVLVEPTSWTVISDPHPIELKLNQVQLQTGENGRWRMDELRIGKTWDSILNQ